MGRQVASSTLSPPAGSRWKNCLLQPRRAIYRPTRLAEWRPFPAQSLIRCRSLQLSHNLAPEDDFADANWRRPTAVDVELGPPSFPHIDAVELQLLADNQPTLCWIASADGYIGWYNRRWHDYCGAPPTDMEGWGWQAIHDPEILPLVMESWTACIAVGEPFEMTFPLRGADGIYRPFLTRVSPLKDRQGRVLRWFGNNIDIAAQRRTETALAESESYVRLLLNSSAEAFYAVDRDGVTTLCNETFLRLMGFAREEDAIGHKLHDLIHHTRPDGSPYDVADCAIYGCASHGVSAHVSDECFYRMDGTPIPVEYWVKPIIIDGDHRGAICTFFDISARKAVEEARRAAEGRLQAHVMEQLFSIEAKLASERETAELREQFIAILGHDLRNPLAALDAGTRMLLRETRSEKARTMGAMMQQSVVRMSGLIDNVLDFARGRLGGAFHIIPVPTFLEPVLNQVVAELQSAWPERTIASTFSLDKAVNCDASRLAQLFSNVLGNALTHGSPSGAIEVRAAVHDNVFELVVSNPSPEIPRTTLDRLFLPFARGDAASDRQGLGLGLFIASQIAQAHHGRITPFWSNGRTTFSFEMPVDQN